LIPAGRLVSWIAAGLRPGGASQWHESCLQGTPSGEDGPAFLCLAKGHISVDGIIDSLASSTAMLVTMVTVFFTPLSKSPCIEQSSIGKEKRAHQGRGSPRPVPEMRFIGFKPEGTWPPCRYPLLAL